MKEQTENAINDLFWKLREIIDETEQEAYDKGYDDGYEAAEGIFRE